MKKTPLLLIIALVVAAAALLWLLQQDGSGGAQGTPGGVLEGAGAPAAADGLADIPRQTGAAPAVEADEAAQREGMAAARPEDSASERAVKLYGSIRGQLVNADRQTLSGADARLGYTSGFSDLGGFNISLGGEEDDDGREARTGESGRFAFEEVEAGRPVQITVSGPFWTRRTVWVAPLEAGESRDLGQLVLSPGHLVRGRVLDPKGRPVEGATAGLTAGTNGGSGMQIRLVGAAGATADYSAETDADGRFEIHGVPEGRYTLFARATGYQEARREGFELRQRSGEREVELRVAAGLSVTGRVLDSNGNPVPSARVAQVGARGFAGLSWQRERLLREGQPVQEDGRFTLNGLPEGESLRVAAAAPEFGRTLSEVVQTGGEVEIALVPIAGLRGFVRTAGGTPVSEAMVELKRADGGATHTMDFSSNMDITDEEGAFAMDEVKAGTYDLTVQSWAGPEKVLEGLVVEPGIEPLDLVLEGANPVTVHVHDEEGAPVAGARVTLKEAAPPSDDFRREMRIRRDEDGEEIILGGGPFLRAKTDEDGLARFYSLQTGSWTATSVAEGFATAATTFERPTEVEQEVQLVQPPAGSLRVTVVDTLGAPVPRTPVKLESLDGAALQDRARQMADDSGLTVWADLAPGEYQVFPDEDRPGTVFIRDHDEDAGATTGAAEERSNALRVAVRAGERTDVQLILAEKALARVQVLRDGRPASGVSVRLRQADSMDLEFMMGHDSADSAKTDASGWAQLPPTEAGEYLLSARSSPANPATEKEVSLVPGRQDLQLELPGGSVRGVLLGYDGPLAGATVKLVPAPAAGSEDGEETEEAPASRGMVLVAASADGGGDEMVETFTFEAGETSTRTGADGVFVFEEVPEGRYVVKTVAEGYSSWRSESLDHDGREATDVGTVSLEAAGGITGTVSGWDSGEEGEDSGPTRFLTLQLQAEDGEMVDFVVANSEGRYRFKDVKPGKYRIEVSQPPDGEEYTTELFEVTPGPDTRMDISVP